MPHRIFIAAAANKGREIAVPAEKLRFRHFARAGPLQFFLRLRHAKAWPHSGSLTSPRSEEHTSELQSLMRISYAVFCLKKKIKHNSTNTPTSKTQSCITIQS